jgi:hypothetical protein
MDLTGNHDYQQLLEEISGSYIQGQVRAAQAVNLVLIDTY